MTVLSRWHKTPRDLMLHTHDQYCITRTHRQQVQSNLCDNSDVLQALCSPDTHDNKPHIVLTSSPTHSTCSWLKGGDYGLQSTLTIWVDRSSDSSLPFTTTLSQPHSLQGCPATEECHTCILLLQSHLYNTTKVSD